MVVKNNVLSYEQTRGNKKVDSLCLEFEVSLSRGGVQYLYANYNEDGVLIDCSSVSWNMSGRGTNALYMVECAEAYKQMLDFEGVKVKKVIVKIDKLYTKFYSDLQYIRENCTNPSDVAMKESELRKKYISTLRKITIK